MTGNHSALGSGSGGPKKELVTSEPVQDSLRPQVWELWFLHFQQLPTVSEVHRSGNVLMQNEFHLLVLNVVLELQCLHFRDSTVSW